MKISGSPCGLSKRRRCFISQVLASMGLGLLVFSAAIIVTMPTVVVGELYNNPNNKDFPLDEYQAAWFGSTILLCQPVGSIASGFLQDAFGRKMCMLLVNIPQIASWLLLYFSNNVFMLYTAGAILGLSLGFMEAPSMSYVGEVCQPHLRGSLTALAQALYVCGFMFEFLIGAAMYWRYTCIACCLVTVFEFIFIAMIPESPTWLLLKGRPEEAEASLRWVRGWVSSEDVKEEFKTYSEQVMMKVVSEKENGGTTQNATSLTCEDQAYVTRDLKGMDKIKFIKDPRMYRPMILDTIIFMTSHALTLVGPRPFFVDILSTLKAPLNPQVVLVISGCIQVFGSIVCFSIIRKTGKRLISFVSIIGNIISCILLSIYVYVDLEVPWVPVVLFVFVFFSGGLGVLTLPWILISEVFPLEGKGLAGGILAAFSYIIAFFFTTTYVYIAQVIYFQGTLLLYSFIGIFGVTYVYFKMPETEGKTLGEIENFFNVQKA